MDEKRVSLDEVAAAFERLIAHVLASACDINYARTIYFAGVDVGDILRGDWDRPSVADISLWSAAGQAEAADNLRPL